MLYFIINKKYIIFVLNKTKYVYLKVFYNETKKINTLHLPVLVEQDEDNVYIVSCPVFKGCHSYGKTIDDALANINEVIQMCIDEEKGRLSTMQFTAVKSLR